MPGKIKKPYSNPLPSELQTSPPSRDPRNRVFYDEWTTKNSRAKAIIMSTLVPGSEAWKIAAQLEYASDIWKALEQKYGPKDETTDRLRPGTRWVESPEIVEAAKNTDHKDDSADFRPNTQPVSVGASESKLGEEASQLRSQAHRHKDASLAEPDIDRQRRDKRLLWALLNGGKDKLDAATIQTGRQLCGL